MKPTIDTAAIQREIDAYLAYLQNPDGESDTAHNFADKAVHEWLPALLAERAQTTLPLFTGAAGEVQQAKEHP